MTSSEEEKGLRIGFVPEHFSTPLHFAVKYFSLTAELVPFPSGTGHMITALRSGEIHMAVGLTEGWIAGLGKAFATEREGGGGYRLVGTYVDSPLCWAISTGADRSDMQYPESFKVGSKVGVSRLGSGSHVMSYVLAQNLSLPPPTGSGTAPFKAVPLHTFSELRRGVAADKAAADFFMWEYFTTKRFYSQGPDQLKQLGEVYTPWPSWMIVAATGTGDTVVEEVLGKIEQGCRYFEGHHDEAVAYIVDTLEYEELDAWAWLEGVRFAEEVGVVKDEVVQKTVDVLMDAGVLWNPGSIGFTAKIGGSEEVLVRELYSYKQ